MNRRAAILTCPLLPLSIASAAPVKAKAEQPLTLRISLKEPVAEYKLQLTVSITNTSESPISFNSPQSRRGWDALRLQFVDPSKASLWVFQRSRDWTGPSGPINLLKKGQALEWTVDATKSDWIWPVTWGRGMAKTVIAHFDQPLQADDSLWHGHIESSPLELPLPISKILPASLD